MLPESEFQLWLLGLDDAQLAEFADTILPTMERRARAEQLRRRREQVSPTHGSTCPPGCCGAGVRQWR